MTFEGINYHLMFTKFSFDDGKSLINKYLGNVLAKRKKITSASFITNTQQRVGIEFQYLELIQSNYIS